MPEELFALDIVVLLPHVASGTVQTRAAMEALTLRDFDAPGDGRTATPVPLPAAN